MLFPIGRKKIALEKGLMVSFRKEGAASQNLVPVPLQRRR